MARPEDPKAALEHQLDMLKANLKGLDAALKLERLFHAQTQLAMWRARLEQANAMVEISQEWVERRQKESRGE